MSLQEILTPYIQQAVQQLFDLSIERIEFQATRKDFEGDVTMVVFPLVKQLKGNPVEIGNKIGEYLVTNVEMVSKFNVVQGFLNLVINDTYYSTFFNDIFANATFGYQPINTGEKAVMVEYASPNTNKPLHLGHVRNVLLGYSVAEILKASGKKVYKTQVINDRGIHICKSMLAWEKFGNGQTPESTGLKGDKLVGNFYVKFENELRSQAKPIFESFINGDFTLDKTNKEDKLKALISEINKLEGFYNTEIEKIDFIIIDQENSDLSNQLEAAITDKGSILKVISSFKKQVSEDYFKGKSYKTIDGILKPALTLSEKIENLKSDVNEIARNSTSAMQEAKEMLRKWEAGDEQVVQLWEMMNGWVYEGFETSYKNIGVDFDCNYYESNTYLLGKDVVEDGLAKGVFYKKEDGSVWIDLTSDGLDEKLVLRSDGTSVYMTQDIGTAIQRVKDFPDVGGMVYTVGNEQDYHFKVLFLILKKLGFDWAEHLYHLSYGMVDLPSGKMKSREGTVVDADDLMTDMTTTAREISEELGKLDGLSQEEKDGLYKTIGLGALKYYILKVDPKKRILFDPKESVDFAGNTGPFIQYTYARIQSILRKADFDFSKSVEMVELHSKEKELIKALAQFPEVIQQAAKTYSPALIANYTYDLVKEYNSFYQSVSILGETDEIKKVFRVQLSQKVAQTIQNAFKLLGIDVPSRM
ncbi:arginine--tRNA ligase [Flavobacterium sp. xlx-214]|nr:MULTISPECIES: arginine--tRNA ligase [unclassified Flavobacterium]MBA5792561.1 arginine--tRNA ligase [Flavobacterium sp. xlx-221]QMI83711.1 arginine--tRNA ligase [Flavobacterium sp. xlx-214]